MAFSEKVRSFVGKLQKLPEYKKKIIFFIIIIVLFLGFGVFEIYLTKNNISRISKSLSSLKLPSANFPDLSINTRIGNDLQNIGSALENISSNSNEVFQDK